MSKYHDAADVLKRGAQKYEQMMEAAKALEEIGSLEQAATEAKAAAAKAGKERDTIIEAKAKAKEELDAVRENILAETDAAMQKLQRISDDATESANSILATARAKAESIIATATEAAQSNADKISALTLTLTKERDAMLVEAKMATAKRDEATAAADSAEKRLAGIKEAIAKLAGV